MLQPPRVVRLLVYALLHPRSVHLQGLDSQGLLCLCLLHSFQLLEGPFLVIQLIQLGLQFQDQPLVGDPQVVILLDVVVDSILDDYHLLLHIGIIYHSLCTSKLTIVDDEIDELEPRQPTRPSSGNYYLTIVLSPYRFQGSLDIPEDAWSGVYTCWVRAANSFKKILFVLRSEEINHVTLRDKG